MGKPPKKLDETAELGMGELLAQTRVAKGLSLAVLSKELRMPQALLAAIEKEQWKQVPPGRERPLVRRIAEHLGLDLSQHGEMWNRVPGAILSDAPAPHREKMERMLMGFFSVGTILLVLWLVVPGPSLKGNVTPTAKPKPESKPLVWVPPQTQSPFPVMGELIPAPPITDAGILLTLRTASASMARIVSEEGDIPHPLQPSDPLTLRVKGPFTLHLANAGGVTVEVAGHRIEHHAAVGEAWQGQFNANGEWATPQISTPAPFEAPVAPVEAPSNAADMEDLGNIEE